jgi:serine/threonine-protein kinase
MTSIGNYNILRKIGEGGFAIAYLAEHKLLSEKACIKQNINISSKDTELLRREAKLMWNLNHHSLPSVKDFFAVGDGSYAIAMNYAEGKNLEELVSSKGAIHSEDVCWITQRLLQATYYINSKGIIHSDIKPQNVIVQPSEHNIILLDYGLSAFRPKGDTEAIGYTEMYAAPELLQGKPPLPESDLYGVGIVMLYALGGDVIAKNYPKNVSEPIRNFCDALLRYSPIERPKWEKVDLVKQLSDVRQQVFGRRHSGK